MEIMSELSPQPVFSIHEEVNKPIRNGNQNADPAAWPFQGSPLPRAPLTDSITVLPSSLVYVCICMFFVCFRENLGGRQFSLLSAVKYNQYISQTEAIDQTNK